MSEFELDGARPRMVSISLKAMKNIIALLECELINGEFESDAEFSMVKELLDECRQAEESSGQIVWHPVKLVPFDSVKHAGLFDFDDEKPDYVWEGSLPEKTGEYLVTLEGKYGRNFVAWNEYDADFLDFAQSGVIAWSELPEPYEPD